jgi:hypothetical protein
MAYKKRAPFAHLSRFGMCTNGVEFGVGSQAQVFTLESPTRLQLLSALALPIA